MTAGVQTRRDVQYGVSRIPRACMYLFTAGKRSIIIRWRGNDRTVYAGKRSTQRIITPGKGVGGIHNYCVRYLYTHVNICVYIRMCM